MCLNFAHKKLSGHHVAPASVPMCVTPDTWNDDVPESQHGKVTGPQPLLKQILRKDHYRSTKTLHLRSGL